MKAFHAATILALAAQVHAHDLYETWNADVTPIACLVGSESGINFLTEPMDDYDYDISARIYIGSLHPGVENPLKRIPNLNPDPYFLNMQILTSLRLRVEDVKVSNVSIALGDVAVAPIVDPEWEHDDLPIVYLGGADAKKLLGLLESGGEPVVKVTLGKSETFQIPVSTKGFRVAKAMMDTCMKQTRRSGLN